MLSYTSILICMQIIDLLKWSCYIFWENAAVFLAPTIKREQSIGVVWKCKCVTKLGDKEKKQRLSVTRTGCFVTQDGNCRWWNLNFFQGQGVSNNWWHPFVPFSCFNAMLFYIIRCLRCDISTNVFFLQVWSRLMLVLSLFLIATVLLHFTNGQIKNLKQTRNSFYCQKHLLVPFYFHQPL